MDKRLLKSEILRGHGSFSAVFNKCRVYKSDYLKLYISFTEQTGDNQIFSPLLNNLKVGFIVSKKKVKKAVKRNYLKRVLRELYRNNKNILKDSSINYILFSFNDKLLSRFEKFNFRLPREVISNDYIQLINSNKNKFTI